jgi:hypothetical protein
MFGTGTRGRTFMLRQYDIDVERRLITYVWAGDLTIEEFAATRKLVAADPRFDVRFDVLADARDATFHEPMHKARQFADEVANFSGPPPSPDAPPRGRIAVVVHDMLSRAVTHQFAAFAALANVTIEAFTDISEAREWLGTHKPGAGIAAG